MATVTRHLAIRELSSAEISTILRSLLSSHAYGVMVTDVQHETLACNRQFGHIWGVDIERVVDSDYETVRQMVRERVVDYEDWLRNLETVYSRPHEVQVDEIDLKNPTATIRRVTEPVYQEDGELLGRLWTFEDISNSAKRRRRREILYSSALLTNPVPSEVYKGITNLAAEFFTSFSFLSIRNGDFMEFWATGGTDNPGRNLPGNPISEAFCQICLADRAPLIIQDARLDPRAQNILPVRLGLTRYAGVPITDSSGEPIGTLCILDNRSDVILDQEDLQFLTVLGARISVEVERQGLLQRLQQDLESTKHSLHDVKWQLVQSEKLGVAGALSASIAHDIRNILATIRLRISMSLDNPQESLQYVDSQLGRFEVLAHRLLSYAKPSRFVTEAVNVHDVILGVVTLLEPQAEAHKVILMTDLAADDPWIQGDPSRLEHLYVNLVINAIQSLSPDGQVVVGTVDGDGCLETYVRDNGPGIPTERLANLFEPFITNRADGFGLGLFSCREIAQSHDATLSCESAINQGTTFQINFPKAK